MTQLGYAYSDTSPSNRDTSMNPIDERFLNSYIETALWSSTDTNGETFLDSNYDSSDLADSTWAAMSRDCLDFMGIDDVQAVIDSHSPEQVAHDFWLTRNHHGAGFWDGDYGDDGDWLTEMSHPYGEAYLYVGDDGMIYQMGDENYEA